MSLTAAPEPAIWHDLECGSYRADLPLWRRLASEQAGPVLEIGAGTGRVALDLASRGHAVTALDLDGDLLGELSRRAVRGQNGRPVALETVTADARLFHLKERFALIAVPMQAIQLMGGAGGRARFLRRAAAHLRPGGLLAMAVTEHFDLYDGRVEDRLRLPAPDLRQVSGTLYRSQSTAVRQEGEVIVLERRREILSGDGSRRVEENRIQLDRVQAASLEREAGMAGLRPAGRVQIPPTSEHVGSVVVVLHA